jgi:hypothetical protein
MPQRAAGQVLEFLRAAEPRQRAPRIHCVEIPRIAYSPVARHTQTSALNYEDLCDLCY